MSSHYFDIDIAIKYGVNCAIFLQNLSFWIEKNAANKKNHKDGYCWTYSSQEGLTILFPYWTRQNIRTVIDKCVSEGLILKGNYNKSNYDKTIWYTLTPKALESFARLNELLKSLGWNQPTEVRESTSRNEKFNQPIPDSKTNNETYTLPVTHLEHTVESFLEKQEVEKQEVENRDAYKTNTLQSKDYNKELPASPSETPITSSKELEQLIELWNTCAVAKGCKPMGNNKRELKSLLGNVQAIKRNWEIKLTPESFEEWLRLAIDKEHYLITKFQQSMPVCLRWKHFEEIYQFIIKESK